MLLAGSVLAVGGGAWLVGVAVLAPYAAALIGAMAAVAFGMGVVVPTAAASELGRHPEMAGSAAALLGAGQIAVGAAATAALSALGTASTPLPMAALIACCTVLSLLSVGIARRPHPAL